MARTKKLNTDLSERKTVRRRKASTSDDSSYDSSFSAPEAVVDAPAADDVTYSMGDIQVSDAEGSGEDEDFKKASAKVAIDSDEDGEDDWIDEDLNFKDEDIFLDMDESFDIDNPYSDDDY